MRRAVWLLLLLTLLGVASAASATTMLYAPVEDMTDASDVVVYGTITDSRTFEGELGHITTEWTLSVDYRWKGEGTDTVQFSQWGGQLGERVAYIPGDGQFAIGDDVVVFLRVGDDGGLYLTAMGQAVFHVSDETYVPQPAAGNVVRAADGGATRGIALENVVIGGSADVFDRVAERALEGVGLYDDATREVRHGEDAAERTSLGELARRIEAAVLDGEEQ